MPTPVPGIDPQTEHARTFKDVWVLLEFLGQQADSRLQSQFEDTRVDLAAPIRKLAAPPCRTYRHFLNRLVSISYKLSGTSSDAVAPSTPAGSPPEGDESLDDLDFLYFSRDFLAAVAAPATVDTIALTRAYISARRLSPFARLVRTIKQYARSKVAPPAEVTRPATDWSGDYADSAGRIARRVVFLEYGTVVLTLITLGISAYALSGRLILDSESQVATAYADIRRDMELAAGESAVGAAERNASNLQSMDGFCSPDPSGGVATIKTAELVTHTDLSDANHTALPPASTIQTVRQGSLCWRLKKAREDVVVAKLHLVSWTGVVIGGPVIGELFGIAPDSINESATLHTEWCERIGAKLEPGGSCRVALRDVLFRSDEVAQSLLGCIALYVLPALYGCLGAAAATFRMLRSKVDASLVSVTDRGRVMQDIVLGLLCGAIMGLFVGYIGKATPDLGLGLSALALLAGYNVSGVFAFLDELCNRVFKPGQPAH
jgi:hypothetical protein